MFAIFLPMTAESPQPPDKDRIITELTARVEMLETLVALQEELIESMKHENEILHDILKVRPSPRQSNGHETT